MSPLKRAATVDVVAWRHRMNISQAELGESLGVSGNTISRWERGETFPEAPKMLTLALRALEMDRAFNAPDLSAAAQRFRRRRPSRGVWDLLPPEEQEKLSRKS